MIRNPILPGFNADPSILRVGRDFYIATSTFEWFPGVSIYHSRDLARWRLRSHALTRSSQLELRGVQGSGGVWAPSLRYRDEDGLFYLAWTNVRNSSSMAFDLRNYLVTAPSVDGPWSEPIYLNASGFDPCIFFDDDGRAWLLNLEWEFRKGYEHPGWIVLQEYSIPERRLVGPIRRVYHGGSDMGCMEGPVLFKKDGWYYLITAEGGTGYGHSAILARSRDIGGPYEADSAGPFLSAVRESFTARGERDFLKKRFYNPDAVMQKTGHASLVDTGKGEWYVAHLGARPVMPEMRCVLNRETSLRRAFWTDEGWLRLEGGRLPLLEVPSPAGLAAAPSPGVSSPAPGVSSPDPGVSSPDPTASRREDFDGPSLPVDFYTLRAAPDPSWLDLRSRPGWLRLRGRESLRSLHEQSLVARRIQHFSFRVESSMEFEPDSYQQMAGLVLMIGTENWYYLRKYWSESLGGPALGIMTCLDGAEDELLEHRVALVRQPGRRAPASQFLAAEVESGRELAFFWSPDGRSWERIGPILDFSLLSDECSRREAFSGTFCGVCAQDLAGRGAEADFDYFRYEVH
jgi:xylan 1,4-beta-xylosidase